MMRWGVSGLSVALIVLASGVAAQDAHRELIVKHAGVHNVPEALVRRVIVIESGGNPALVSGDNYGLMQIKLGTARAMGYLGSPEGLLDADTNMTYAVKYLAGAYRAAGCDAERAVAYYQRGYYGAAQFKCGAMQLAGAQAEMTAVDKPASKPASDVAAAQADAKPQPIQVAPPGGDAIKPKAVRTVSVTGGDWKGDSSASAPEPDASPFSPQPSGKPDTFEDRLRPVRGAKSLTTGARAAVDSQLATAAETETVTEKRSEPPPKRKRRARSEHPAETRVAALNHSAPSKHRRVRAKNDTSSSGDLISFLKGLVTPDKKTPVRKRSRQAQTGT